MRLVVFGPTGRVGIEVVTQALALGHEVVAYARASSADAVPEGARVVTGELDDSDAMRTCVKGAGAVVSALGARSNDAALVALFGDALALITQLMAEEGVARLVSISGAGTLLEGERPGFGRRIARSIMKLVARHALECKQREAAVILATDLEWVLVRPPRIVDGDATGQITITLDQPHSTKITTGDVAAFMLRAATEDEWVRGAPFVAAT